MRALQLLGQFLGQILRKLPMPAVMNRPTGNWLEGIPVAGEEEVMLHWWSLSDPLSQSFPSLNVQRHRIGFASFGDVELNAAASIIKAYLAELHVAEGRSPGPRPHGKVDDGFVSGAEFGGGPEDGEPFILRES